MHVAIYWIGKDIYNYNNKYHNLKNNNTIKTMKPTATFHYGDLTYCQNPKSKYPKHKTRNQNNLQQYTPKRIPKAYYFWQNTMEN